MRILLTGAGGAAAVSVWKSLNAEHELHMADMDACAAGLYLVPSTQRLLIPSGKSREFAETILQICKARKIELVIATVDAELSPLADAIQKFTMAGIKVPLCSYDVLQYCYDKYALLVRCQNIIPVPEFILLTEENITTITTFPRFAKPRIGSGSSGIKLINNYQDLTDLPCDGSYLIQELLPGDEYSVDVYFDSNKHPIAAVPRLRMKVDSGVAVTTRTVNLPELAEMAVKTGLTIGIRYAANIQFKQAADGVFKLLEINPRFSGALPLTIAAGVDIPKLLVSDIQGETLPMGLMPYKELMVVRYWTEHFISPTEWDQLCQH